MNGPTHHRRPALFAFVTLLTGGVLFAVFAAMVLQSRAELVAELHRRIVEREAAVLRPFALQQLVDAPGATRTSITALLRNARQEGMIAVAIFDATGATIDAVPADQLFVELPIEDYVKLQATGSISRYHAEFPLDEYFAGVAPGNTRAPVLEVLLAVPGTPARPLLGFVRYYLDARPLTHELTAIDARLGRQTANTLLVGAAVVTLVMAAAAFGLHRAQRTIAERNARLVRANLELSLAAKASALGQVTSHLIHGLQGPVAGLQAAVTAQTSSDWESAAIYTRRMQEMIQETVALLRDIGANTTYEIEGEEMAEAIRRQNSATAAQAGVSLIVEGDFPSALDSHRGGLICLIASNLIQNAIAATPPGREVRVWFERTTDRHVLRVGDQGEGIPDSVRPHLFTPGRSGAKRGSGLGLAISRLMALQIGAELVLEKTGPEGTVFAITLPTALAPASGIASPGQDRR